MLLACGLNHLQSVENTVWNGACSSVIISLTSPFHHISGARSQLMLCFLSQWINSVIWMQLKSSRLMIKDIQYMLNALDLSSLNSLSALQPLTRSPTRAAGGVLHDAFRTPVIMLRCRSSPKTEPRLWRSTVSQHNGHEISGQVWRLLRTNCMVHWSTVSSIITALSKSF
jgi:hypothetical protein